MLQDVSKLQNNNKFIKIILDVKHVCNLLFLTKISNF